MSLNERVRLETLGRVKRGELTVVSAASVCGLSVRQMRRAWKRFKASGAKGLMHGLRGRVSNRRTPVEVADRVVKLKFERYGDFGQTHACEKLQSEHGISISPDTLTAVLKERGLWERRRRRDKHRRRRERRACFGDMVQMDGSHHDWFEGRAGQESTCVNGGLPSVMMVMIDDATNTTDAKLYAGETTEAAFDVTGRWIQKHGVPCALYVDRASIYRDEGHPEKPTQFGRAMKELGVELILARSPQAKGRVENRHKYFQNRFVRELRLRNINTIETANVFLTEVFLPKLNRELSLRAREDEDHHRGVVRGMVLEEVLCVTEQRVVGNDACVRWKNRWLQIDGTHVGLARKRVRVKQRGDGRLVIEHKGERLSFTELKSGRQSGRILEAKGRKTIVNNRRWKPPTSHPWNRTPACGNVPSSRLPPAAPGGGGRTERRQAG